jgi:hypothetical protein
MGWARLDDSFHDHPKLIGLSLEALGLWTKCLTWAHRHHDSERAVGYLPEGLPALFAGSRAAKLSAELVAHRLWDRRSENESDVTEWSRTGSGEVAVRHDRGDGEGWYIHGYADYLPASERPQTASDVRKARSEAGKRGAEARWAIANDGKPDSKADGKLPSRVDGKPMPPNPTRPEPEPEATTDVVALSRAFDNAWSHWPKKTERKKAAEQYTRAAKKLGADVLLDAVTRFGDAYAATTEKQFVPALGVWLSHERWTDELPQSRQAQQQPARQSRGAQALDFAMTLPEGGNALGSSGNRAALGGGIEY